MRLQSELANLLCQRLGRQLPRMIGGPKLSCFAIRVRSRNRCCGNGFMLSIRNFKCGGLADNQIRCRELIGRGNANFSLRRTEGASVVTGRLRRHLSLR